MKDLTKWRQAVLTENDLTPAVGNSVKLGSKVNATIEQKYYPKKMRKEIKAQPLTSDLVAGFLQPIVYALNKGKTISPNSDAHCQLRILLEKANQ